MGRNLPPGVTGSEDYFTDPPTASCDTCGSDMWSPADHADDCPEAPWNEGQDVDADAYPGFQQAEEDRHDGPR
jgi:hypothetical protein